MTPGDALFYRFQNSRFLGIQGKLVSPVSPVARGGAGIVTPLTVEVSPNVSPVSLCTPLSGVVMTTNTLIPGYTGISIASGRPFSIRFQKFPRFFGNPVFAGKLVSTALRCFTRRLEAALDRGIPGDTSDVCQPKLGAGVTQRCHRCRWTVHTPDKWGRNRAPTAGPPRICDESYVNSGIYRAAGYRWTDG